MHLCPCLFVAFFMPCLRAEIFTSVQDVTQLFNVERKVVDALSDYLAKTEARLDKIRSYLHHYDQVRAEVGIPKTENMTSREVEDQMTERLAGNPIHAYHLVKRLTIDWQNIEEHDPKTDWKTVEEALLTGEIYGFSQFANEEDLQGAAQALIRLQSVYQLNTTNLVHGNVWGIQTAAELTAQDCLYLGKNSFNLGMYYNAIEWFEQAYSLAGLEKNKTITQDQVMNFLNRAVETYDVDQQRHMNEQDTSEELMKKNLNLFSAMRSRHYEIAKKKFKVGEELNHKEDFQNFEALCRGEQLLSDDYVATLKCFYDRRNSPYFTLMPAKIEQRHHDPQILIFHDAIRETDINRIKELSKPQLARGLVQAPGGKGSTVSSTRISKTAWLNKYEEMAIFRNLNLRITYLTGLSSDPTDNSAEQLQIANYGIGGHYIPHRDYLMADKSKEDLKNFDAQDIEKGDRIATFMFYLSDVSRGGATAFPKLGVSLFPEKGSAAFWYNLKRSGNGDTRSLHGGCPVVHGSKWVSNKWIREINQFRRRPCGLSEEE